MLQIVVLQKTEHTFNDVDKSETITCYRAVLSVWVHVKEGLVLVC